MFPAHVQRQRYLRFTGGDFGGASGSVAVGPMAFFITSAASFFEYSFSAAYQAMLRARLTSTLSLHVDFCMYVGRALSHTPSAAVPNDRSSNDCVLVRCPLPPKMELKKPIVLCTTTLVHCTNTFNRNLLRKLHVG